MLNASEVSSVEARIRAAVKGKSSVGEAYLAVSALTGISNVTVNHAVYPLDNYVIGYMIAGSRERQFLKCTWKEQVH